MGGLEEDAVAVLFDVARLPARDRADALHGVLAESDSVRVEIDHHAGGRAIAGIGAVRDIGTLSVFSAQASPITIRRTPRLARDDFEPSLVLGVQVSGSSIIEQDGKQAVMRPGDMNLVDTTRPYTSYNPDGADQHWIRIPRAHLALSDDLLARITAARLAPDNPVVDLVSGFFGSLIDGLETLETTVGADLVDKPGVELVRAMICTQLGRDDRARAPLEDTRLLRIMQYVRAHLADADLTPARIAQANFMSVRQLYSVLARGDVNLGDWIRSRRLEECRKELSRPGADSSTIAAIAHRWGFGDASNFGRAFRQAYGMSPRQWRQLHQQPRPDGRSAGL